MERWRREEPFPPCKMQGGSCCQSRQWRPFSLISRGAWLCLSPSPTLTDATQPTFYALATLLHFPVQLFCLVGFFPFGSKSSRGYEFENFSGAWCVCGVCVCGVCVWGGGFVCGVCCLHMDALCLLALWMTFPPTLSPFTHPFPRILWSPAFLGAAYDFPWEGLCVFWLNDSLHISSPTLSPFGCTSASFLLLALGALFLGVLFPPLPPLPPPQQGHPSASLTALHFPPTNTLPRASVTCENSFQTCLLETGRQMKDFFIKIRHFREASSKALRVPRGTPSAQNWRGALGFGKGLDQVLWASPPPLLLTQTPSLPGQGGFEPRGLSPGFLPIARILTAAEIALL